MKIAGLNLTVTQVIRDLSLDLAACGKIAEILDIDGDGESPADVVQYAFVEHVKAAGERGQKAVNDAYERIAYKKRAT